MPNPNPIVNGAVVNYTYTVDPSIPNGKSNTDLSNLIKTTVKTAIIGVPNGEGQPGGSGVLKLADPMYADIGVTVTYTLVLTNTGNTTAKNVVVYDTIPVGSNFIANSVTINGNVTPGVNPQNGIDVGNINPAVTVTVTFKAVTVSIPPSKSLVDTPMVEYSYTVDPNKEDISVTEGGNTVTIPVNNATISTKDGGFVKTQNPNYATIGDRITYTMLVKNTGSVDATNVKVVDMLNSALKFVSGSVKVNGITQSTSNPNVGIIIGTVNPNQVVTISFAADVITVPNKNPIENQAVISYDYRKDPNTVISVTNPSNITNGQINYVNISEMTKSSDMGYVKLNDILTYTITIPNTGNVAANNVIFKDTIPMGTSFVTNSATVNGLVQGGQNPQTTGISVGTINPLSFAVVQFKVLVQSIPDGGILLNQGGASYTYTVDPSVPNGRTGSGVSNIITTTVTNASIVGPTGTPGANNTGYKVGTPDNADIGDTVTYSISLYNSGNVDALNVIVKDTVPNCTSLVNGSIKVNGVSVNDSLTTGVHVGTIKANQTAIVNYSVIVTCLPKDKPEVLKNTANVSYSFITDPSKPATNVNGETNTSTIPVTTASFGSINGQNGIVKTASLNYADVGDKVTFTISLTNLGNTIANNVVFKDTIPESTSFVQGSVKVNGVSMPLANPNGGINLGNLAPTVVTKVEFDVIVLEVPKSNPIKNQAGVGYTYTVNPSIPNGRIGNDLSNQTSTQVNNAVIGERVTPGNPNGSGVIKSVNPQVADIGDTVTYTFIVKNTGNVQALNVIVKDDIQVGAIFVNDSVKVNGSLMLGANIESGVNIGNVAPGAISTVTFNVKVVSLPNSHTIVDTPAIEYGYRVDPNGPVKQVIGGGNTVTLPVNTASISKEDGGITKTANPSYVTIGDTITYTIGILNTGSIKATSVVVYDTLQDGLVFSNDSVKINGVSKPGVSPILGIQLGTVNPNTPYTITFDAVVYTVPNPNPITNTANISYSYSPDGQKVVTVTNPSPTTKTPVNYVDISKITKSSSPSYVEVSDIITYTVIIPNEGNTAANNVIIRDTIPEGASFIIDSVIVNGISRPGENPETTGINVGTISPKMIATVTFKALVVSIPLSGLIKNQAEACYAFTVDPAKPNCRKDCKKTNIDTVTVTDATLVVPPTVPCSDVNGMIKFADKKIVTIGDIVTYTVRVYNSGNVDAVNTVINDTVPECSEFVASSIIVDGIAAPSQNIVNGINLGTVKPKEIKSASYKVKVTCLPKENILKNTAYINYEFTKNPKESNKKEVLVSNTVTIPVVTAGFCMNNCNCGIVKSADLKNATVGDKITYTIALTNTGNTDAINVKVVDTLPSGTSFVQDSLKVNGVSKPNSSPEGGVSIGTIGPNKTSIVTFEALVTEVPKVNPIVNSAKTYYEYVVDPSLPNKTGSSTSNSVETLIKYAVIGNQLEFGNPKGSGIIKSANKTTVDIGDTITYTLVAKNTGNVIAEDVVVYDTIPSGSKFLKDSVIINGFATVGVNPTSGIDVGNIQPGEVATITLKVTVVSLPTSKAIVNKPMVKYNYTVDELSVGGVMQTAGGNTVTIPVQTAIIENADGGLVKEVDKDFAKLSEVVSYTIRLKNTGTVSATNTRIFDTIPNGFAFIEGSVTVDSTMQNSSPETGILVGTIMPNEERVVRFKVSVIGIPDVNPAPNLCDVVYSYGMEEKCTRTIKAARNTSNTVYTKVNYINFDNATKEVDKKYADVGDTLTYTIGLPNDGNVSAINVFFRDDIPQGTTFVENSLSVNGILRPGTSPMTGLNVGNIAPKQTLIVRFKVTINDPNQ